MSKLWRRRPDHIRPGPANRPAYHLPAKAGHVHFSKAAPHGRWPPTGYGRGISVSFNTIGDDGRRPGQMSGKPIGVDGRQTRAMTTLLAFLAFAADSGLPP